MFLSCFGDALSGTGFGRLSLNRFCVLCHAFSAMIGTCGQDGVERTSDTVVEVLYCLPRRRIIRICSE